MHCRSATKVIQASRAENARTCHFCFCNRDHYIPFIVPLLSRWGAYASKALGYFFPCWIPNTSKHLFCCGTVPDSFIMLCGQQKKKEKSVKLSNASPLHSPYLLNNTD